MSNTKELAGKLNQLLEKNYDSEKGFENAAKEVKNEGLKQYFEQKAKQRYDFGHELKTEIKNLGETPEKGTSFAADAHHAWMNLKAAFSSNNEEALLKEAVRGEKLAVEEYNEIIKNHDFPPSTANLLIKQRNFIERTFNEVKDLEASYE